MRKSDANITIQNLKDVAKKFRDDRDWAQFHNPKELAIDMSIESGELLELFLWKSNEEIKEKLISDEIFRQNVLDEVADVAHACLAFANTADIDLASAVIAKIEKTAEKYPVEKAKGQNKKYTDL
jgi:NTP pyrophosphatase (non-canonical NTP hydrolase)